jgi:hypothetical protein
MNTIKDVFAQASACLPTFYATIYPLKIVISQNSKGFAGGSINCKTGQTPFYS